MYIVVNCSEPLGALSITELKPVCVETYLRRELQSSQQTGAIYHDVLDYRRTRPRRNPGLGYEAHRD